MHSDPHQAASDVDELPAAFWQRGALMGAAAEEAFFVRCDDENNPPERARARPAAGEVGVAPVAARSNSSSCGSGARTTSSRSAEASSGASGLEVF